MSAKEIRNNKKCQRMSLVIKDFTRFIILGNFFLPAEKHGFIGFTLVLIFLLCCELARYRVIRVCAVCHFPDGLIMV